MIASAFRLLGADTIATMSTASEELLRRALELPARERAAVAAELVSSLDEDPSGDGDEIAGAWARELERRAQRALSGEDPGRAWPELRERLQRTLDR